MINRRSLYSIFVAKSSRRLVEFFRYFLVSVISLSVDFLLLYVLTGLFGIYYLVSAVFSYLTGLVINYLLSTYWVFSRRKMTNRAAEFSIFALIGVIGLGTNELIMWLFTGVFLIQYMISRFFSAGIGYVWKYIVRKYLLFR